MGNDNINPTGYDDNEQDHGDVEQYDTSAH